VVMSLLNDALRAAEQRQKRPEVAAAYVGQTARRQSSARWLIPLLLLVIAILAVAVLYERFSQESAQPLMVGQGEAEATTEAAAPVAAPLPASPPMAETTTPEANAAVIQVAQDVKPRPVESAGIASTEPEPSSSPAGQPEPLPQVPEPVRATEEVAVVSSIAKEATDAKKVNTKTVVPAEHASKAEQLAEAPAVPTVKQQRETPEAADMRASRKLSRLLKEGKLGAAEALMGEIEKTQVAPVSRGVLTRSLLVQGLPDRALHWLPEPVTADYPTLRLLRSRGLLATGDLSGAVATLLQDVPPVKNHIEYRVTLATLLQQSGQSMASARQWSALLAVDDSRAAWWVGLAIALESQGEAGAAVRAYGQAAQLPGLSSSLADYVRQRIHKLQAG
jgi:MSHA biogenesis protein MshN